MITNRELDPDDEICSGNGYWFYFKERKLVEKYLFGDKEQPFHPVSTANDVLQGKDEVFTDQSLDQFSEQEEESKSFPGQDDLEYPDSAVSLKRGLKRAMKKSGQTGPESRPAVKKLALIVGLILLFMFILLLIFFSITDFASASSKSGRITSIKKKI